VWATLKKVQYVPLALSGVSSFGVASVFLLHDAFCFHLDGVFTALIFTLLAGFYFARGKRGGEKAEVSTYIISSALVLMLGNFIRHLHDIKSILFGNAVLVETKQIIYVAVAAIIIFAIHILKYRKFLYVSFDSESAAAAGFSSYWNNVFIYGTFAIMISVSSRAIGSLPVFGLTILPALTGLNIAKSMKTTFIATIMTAVFSSVFGYYLSFVFELPTGATIVTIAGVLYLLSFVFKKI